MSDCHEVHQRLYLYLDRELLPEEVIEIRQHILNCKECFELVSFESGVIKLIKRDCGCDKAPDHLKARIKSILKKKTY
ncbi:anti-sigma factor [Thermobaculum terrenum ATCC BAA-798]|uniref:Anti-sigma factor n=1 Tax=Thermobaculum terrenum (strain ATCC BAA-798 / CCMEE 7001 / YNP1) TaxID=525904 RepID=D1CFG6_THET1|nr:anti-sigma factor [Thermobaculum terrenum ATCC BAA-798]